MTNKKINYRTEVREGRPWQGLPLERHGKLTMYESLTFNRGYNVLTLSSTVRG